MAQYQVVVGTVYIGTVYTGGSFESALAYFHVYQRKSLNGEGRAANEDVTLMADGEPIREHYGKSEEDAA